MKQCRTCQHTYDDDTYQFCLEDGSLLSPVFNANATLVLNDSPDLEVTLDIDDTNTKPNRVSVVKNKPTNQPSHNFINDPVVAICINEQFPNCKTTDDLYTCTRGLWRLSQERAEHAKYAFAIYKGEIKEVYEIERWLPATKVFSDFWVARLERQGRTDTGWRAAHGNRERPQGSPAYSRPRFYRAHGERRSPPAAPSGNGQGRILRYPLRVRAAPRSLRAAPMPAAGLPVNLLHHRSPML